MLYAKIFFGHHLLAFTILFIVKQVAQFLRVNPDTGLFFFDSTYRPVPLAQQYIGISEPNFAARNEMLNDICYSKVLFHLHFLQNLINLAVLAMLIALAPS